MSTTVLPSGVALLAAYLEREGLSHEAFAARDTTGRIDRPLVGRLLSGERAKRVSVNLAAAIERASGGAVPAASWETPVDLDGPTVDRSADFNQTAPGAP